MQSLHRHIPGGDDDAFFNPLDDCIVSSIGGHCSHLKKEVGGLFSLSAILAG